MFSLPGFELLEIIGEGGMAKVWKARQVRLGRIVAIKVLRYKLSQDEDDQQRFLFEAQTTANISHPNIVQVIDAGVHEGQAYYVMEYIPGNTIADLLDVRRTIPEHDALMVASELALALDYCWNEHRMTHCDIKPDNVLLHSNGTVKLADLGLARVMDFTSVPIEEDMIMGTPNYMSPEQALGEEDLDCRADIYSLGAMLYHMLTGVLPFSDLSEQEALQQQVYGYLPDPTTVNPNIGSGVAWLLEKMMSKDRELRPATWREVYENIELILEGFMIRGGVPPADASTIRRDPSRSVPVAACGGLGRGTRAGGRRSIGASSGTPRRKVIISSEDRAKMRQLDHPYAAARAGRSWSLLATVTFVAVLLYGFTIYRLQHPLPTRAERNAARERAARAAARQPSGPVVVMRAREDVAPTVIRMDDLAAAPKVDRHTGEVLPEPPSRERPESRPAPRPVSREAAPTIAPPAPEPVTAQNWRNRDFRRGMNHLREASNSYQAFLRGPRDKIEALRQIEHQARSAVESFKRAKSEAPSSVDVDQKITDSNKLLFNAHQSMKAF